MSTTSTEEDNFNLLSEINEYIENKEDIYNQIQTTEINNLVLTDMNDIKTEVSPMEEADTAKRHTSLKQFFNDQYENNIKIGDYYNDKIIELNQLIYKKETEYDNLRTTINKQEITRETAEKALDIEYNNIVINKLVSHILLVVICVLVLMVLLCILKSLGGISGYVVLFIDIVLVVGIMMYISYLLYSKYPRRNDDYHRFEFKTEDENKPRNYKPNNGVSTEKRAEVDAKLDTLIL